ncbi:hypothetical protein PVNG_02341 [Plasmodium vivax North Korean]|uniref:UvrD-like helicase ATP-binding domain-containing protein n=1 Tax=Plasmodium vivax North Korean TaxID=1035514 RepID=A0A0J9W6K8_PLAVI|nr:hypothetical protein PVNG_02341 [Plasmodium vivax North Korean]
MPVLKVSNIQDGKIIIDKTELCNFENFSIENTLNPGEVIFTLSGSLGKVGINLTSQKFLFTTDLIAFDFNKLLSITLYMYYYLLNYSKEIIHKLKKGGIIPHIYKSDLKKFKIKLPSLEIQEEIVEMLDKFSSKLGVVDILKKEFKLRRQQYEYYRRLLVSPVDYLNKKFKENYKEIIDIYDRKSLNLSVKRNLNEQQEQAVEFSLDKDILIIAGAGTGKTKTLVERYKHLIESGIAKQDILVTTFTRQAKREIEERISEDMVEREKREIEVYTNHQFCRNIILDY